ncbi:Ankyrin repeat domain-containing protein 50 [Phytophthora citrophthora]|uniref:Ankyrin repeat domain-containing protein 50 n=1 Tax=Phytophthora citrophthora TaxID=4793 RepID=A0AAD9GPM8_9STRA|nr:Ankyrin repeat domain-containing protein 50 [Phytophthora citrophthora]
MEPGASHSTAMCWAAAEGNLEAMRRLREEHGADVNSADYDKRTPLHIAVSDEQLEMVDYLLQCGANSELLDRWGRSPIDCALETKNVAILRSLERENYGRGKFSLLDEKLPSIDEAEGMRRIQSSSDIVSFFRAVQEGNAEKVKSSWLGGMEVNVTDELGRTSLHVAVENGQLGVIELLLSAGVSTNVVDTRGRSPISIALELQQFVIAEMLRAHQEKKLVSRQVKSSEDEQNIALAFRATKQGEMEKLKQLVPELVRPDMEDYDLRTLLHVASAEGHLQIAKYLVDCGANVNLLDRWGSSPLSDAVDFAHNELAKFLIANHATESGFRATVAVDHIDNATLAGALEFTLRVVTKDPWLMGQVHCPVLDDNNNCILVTHSIWHKNNKTIRREKPAGVLSPRAAKNQPIDTAGLWSDAIQKYRKVSSIVMIDPGQGHIGSVFSGQHPEWLDLHSAQQSQFFLLPHARRAGIQTVVSVPMICKMSTVAVLSWYSDRIMTEDQHELQRIQRVVRSVMILSTLRQELLSAASSNIGVGRIPRFQYCQTLDNAITANGELTDSSIRREDLSVCDTTPLALEWGLFDMVDTLATSMSSEDHAAVVPILRSLVLLLHNGLFNEALDEHGHGEPQDQSDDSSLKHVIEQCDGKIRTKWDLLGHVKYYLQYLYTVSPTEAELFTDVQELTHKVERYLKSQAGGDNTNGDSGSSDDMEIDEGPVPSPPEPSPTTDIDCVLCKYNVPGHIHPGREPIPATPSPPKPTPFHTKTSKSPDGEKLFGHAENPKSPVYRQIEQLLDKLEGEYDAFERKAELADCRDASKPATFTSSDLYDAIGAAHDTPAPRRNSSADNPRKQLLDVINEIMQDTSCVITREQLFALHRCLLPPSSGQAGVLRTDLAVGYASPRIYRVFIPAGEIEDALDKLLDMLNDASQWEQRPLLCAYYAFAVLVFYIHPFHDGNGRCARLLGNLVAKKLGFPPLLRAADKTIQVPEFLQKAIVTMEIIRNSRRQTRQTRMLSTRRENSSMWF